MPYFTDGSIPRDTTGYPVGSVYVPNVGTVGVQGGTVATDNDAVPYAPLVVQQLAYAAVNGTLQNAAAANGNGTPLALLGNASVILTVTMTGFTGTINFEVSEDSVNYDPIQVQQMGTNLITTSVTGSTTTSTHLYECSVAGLQNLRARVSGFSAGTVTVTAHAIPSTDAPRALNAVFTDGQKATYAASITGLASAASATDIFTITGSASKTIRVTRLEVSGQQTTAAAAQIIVLKRSTANTSGTSTNPTAVPYDSNSAAATATINAYTANPTTGSLVGNLKAEYVFLAAPGTATVGSDKLFLDFGNRPSQAIVLRGATQVLAVNLNGATVTGGAFDINIEWTEE